MVVEVAVVDVVAVDAVVDDAPLESQTEELESAATGVPPGNVTSTWPATEGSSVIVYCELEGQLRSVAPGPVVSWV